MRTLWTLLIFLLAALALGQDYTPRPGETDLKVMIENRGTIWIKLYTAEAPKTCQRIVELANQRFFDGQRFFEVARSPKPYMARIGDPNSRTKSMDDKTLGTYSTGVKIPFEDSGYKHVEGAVGMSRLPTDKDTGDCQFYIMLGQHKFLDGSYTVFGQVVQGLDILRKLEVGDKVSSVTVVKG
jgi:cyclophilin family peptidyl-prolyl cis-trans isomerase